jgi:hypothetical protein
MSNSKIEATENKLCGLDAPLTPLHVVLDLYYV